MVVEQTDTTSEDITILPPLGYCHIPAEELGVEIIGDLLDDGEEVKISIEDGQAIFLDQFETALACAPRTPDGQTILTVVYRRDANGNPEVIQHCYLTTEQAERIEEHIQVVKDKN